MREMNIDIKVTNIPSAEDYFNRSYELFIECFKDLLSLMHLNEGVCECENDDEEEFSINDEDLLIIKKKQAIDISTKLHHISEIFLSGLIAKSNPLNLIQINNVVGDDEIDFDECLTMPAHQLLDSAKKEVGKDFFTPLFDEITFKDGYERNRKIRNKNMHSLVRNFDFDINRLLKDFLTVWFVLFKKVNFIKDFYRITLTNYFELECEGLYHAELWEDIIEKIERIPFMKNHRVRVIKRRLLFKIVFLISNILTKKELEDLLEISKKIEKNNCYCPNCVGVSRIHFSEGYIDYKEYKYPYQPKTLLIEKGHEKAFCYICGFKINNKKSFKKYCKECKEDTYFVKYKIKGFQFNDKRKDDAHEFCLFCGETKNDPMNNENDLIWYD